MNQQRTDAQHVGPQHVGPQHAHADRFADRPIGPGDADTARMLELLGYADLDALIDAAVPGSIRSTEPLDLPPAATEPQALSRLRAFADANTVNRSMIGLGYYGTYTPGVIGRNVLENPS